MTTASQILTRAARSLGYLGRTASLSAADANDALTVFNAMLDSWSNEKLLSYVVLERSFALIVGQTTYTVGSGGYLNSTRPYDIVQAYILDNDQNRYLMNIWPRDRWNEIVNLQPTLTSQIPTDLFYDPQYPLGVINVFPTPLIAYSLYFDSTQDQVDFASLTQALSMPVGYERAYVTNLALELMAAGFPCLLDQKQLAALTNMASESKGNIKRANIKDVIAKYDDAVVARSNATYNIYSDSPARGNT